MPHESEKTKVVARCALNSALFYDKESFDPEEIVQQNHTVTALGNALFNIPSRVRTHYLTSCESTSRACYIDMKSTPPRVVKEVVVEDHRTRGTAAADVIRRLDAEKRIVLSHTAVLCLELDDKESLDLLETFSLLCACDNVNRQRVVGLFVHCVEGKFQVLVAVSAVPVKAAHQFPSTPPIPEVFGAECVHNSTDRRVVNQLVAALLGVGGRNDMMVRIGALQPHNSTYNLAMRGYAVVDLDHLFDAAERFLSNINEAKLGVWIDNAGLFPSTTMKLSIVVRSVAGQQMLRPGSKRNRSGSVDGTNSLKQRKVGRVQ